jgi:hypothetical protein
MPPRHPAAGTSTRQRAGSVPVSPTPAGGVTATRPPPPPSAFEEHHRVHHARHLRTSIVSSDPVPESDREDDRPPRSGQPSPDGSLEAREREDSVGLLSAPSSQPSPRASLLGSRNGSAASLQTARSFTSQTSPLSLLSQSVQSEDTTSGSTQTQTRTVTQAQSQAQTRQYSPEGGLPIPLPQTHVSVTPPSPPPPPAADLSTAAASLVTMPPTIVSQSTESSGRTPTSPSGMEHYAPPHTRTFTTPH